MKRILLASASIVAFAGASAAQEVGPVTFGGSAELGFNDEEENGFFYEAELDVNVAVALDNGLTTNLSFTIPVVENNLGNSDIDAESFELAIAAEDFGGLFFGDTATAAEIHWDPGFAMASDGFTEQDNEVVLRGDAVFGGFTTSVSAVVADPQGDIPGASGEPGRDDDDEDYIDQISIGASGAVGTFVMDFGYQSESDIDLRDPMLPNDFDTDNGDFSVDEIIAVAAGTTFSGADVKLGFSRTNYNYDNPTRGDVIGQDGEVLDSSSSYGALVRFPFGPVTASASYTFEPDFAENSYRVGAVYESGPVAVGAYYESEIGDTEFGIEGVYSPSETTRYAFGYVEDINDDDLVGGVTGDIDDDQDEGYYVQARQGIGAGAYVEASYSQFTDAGPDEVREGTTVLVGFEF